MNLYRNLSQYPHNMEHRVWSSEAVHQQKIAVGWLSKFPIGGSVHSRRCHSKLAKPLQIGAWASMEIEAIQAEIEQSWI